jgi:hypothetical protein
MVDIILTIVIVAVVGGATVGWLIYSQRKSSGHRQADLERVQRWFQPAFDAGETLQAAIGVSAGKRVLLLTDRAIRVVARKFWVRRFKAGLDSFPVGSVGVRFAPPGHQTGRTALEIGEAAVGAIGVAGATAATGSLGTLWIDNQHFSLDGVSCRMAGSVGSSEDIRLLLRAGRLS